MARSGAKPSPAQHRILAGTHRRTRHGDPQDVADRVDQFRDAFGPISAPEGLPPKAMEAWIRFIQPATWLDASREPAAIAFCHLWAEFLEDPKAFQSARHGQMRAYMNELGLTDERNRRAVGDENPENPWLKFL